MAAPPPPPPARDRLLKRNISKSLDSITDAIRKHNHGGNSRGKALMLPPRPHQQQQPVSKPPKPLPPPPTDYEIISVPPVVHRSKPTPKTSSAKCYDLETFCREVSLPRAVEITDGFCCPTEDIPIGFQMMIYFQKTARVVQAKDALDSLYNIPLGSSLKFAPIDELKPAGDQTGFYYDTVETMLMERPSLPKVVKVQHAFTKGRHSVMSNDIVFPKKIEKNLLGNKIVGLVCTKMNGEDIKLPLECSCGFSTSMKDTQLYIMEYIEFVNQFPVKVSVFGDLNSEFSVTMPSTLTLLKEYTMKSVVARSRHSKTNDHIVEMPTNLPIQLKCLEEDITLEHGQVKSIYETFDPSLVSNYYSLAETNSQYQAQQQLYSKVRSDVAGSKYYNLAIPEKIYETMQKELTNTLPLARSKSVSVDDDLQDNDLEKSIGAKSSPGPKHKLLKAAGNLLTQAGKSLKTSHHDGTAGSDEMFTNQLESLQQEVAELKNSLEKLKVDIKEEIKQQISDAQKFQDEEIRKIRLGNARCMQQVSRVSESLDKLKQKPGPSSSSKPPSKAPINDVYLQSPQDNKQLLQSLDHLKILQILDGMNLSQYCATFRDARVDGQLLATLTQTELIELKVNSALHQRKLLNIIDGKESAEKYLRLSSEDPYYT